MKKQREIVKSIKNVKHQLKLIKPSVFNSKIVFYSTRNFKDRDYPEFDFIKIYFDPDIFIIDECNQIKFVELLS